MTRHEGVQQSGQTSCRVSRFHFQFHTRNRTAKAWRKCNDDGRELLYPDIDTHHAVIEGFKTARA